MTLGSLFSGIGGLDLGLERAGFLVRWQVEINPWCRRVLAKHWPCVPRYIDIRTVGGNELERVDCICGGFPCQPVSVAGWRTGEDDERWLWPEFARIVRSLRPRVVIVENVPGLFVRGFGRVIGDLAASGYDTEWDCIPAAAVGAKHRRDRVFIVAYPSESRLPLSERARLFGPGRREEGRAIAQCGWWASEPVMDRVAYGIPGRVDRLKGLGNAVVPQVAEEIGRRVIEVFGMTDENEKRLMQIGRCAFGNHYPDDPVWLPCALKEAGRYCATHNPCGLDRERVDRQRSEEKR